MMPITLFSLLLLLRHVAGDPLPRETVGAVYGAETDRPRQDVVVLGRFPSFTARVRVTPPDPATAPRMSARAAGVWDPSTRTLLYGVNVDGAMQLASVTKLMTALVALETPLSFEENVTMEAETNETPGSRLRVPTGAVFSVGDVFDAALVGSGNNATRALVRATGLSEDAFVARMNEKAAQLGMAHTRFTDVTGLAADNVSTVRDLVRLADAAFARDRIRAATSSRTVTIADRTSGRRFTVASTDELLGSGLRVVAGKTGFTESAGGNFVSRIRGIGERELVFLVLGSMNQHARFTDTRALADWVFARTVWQ